MLNINCRLDSAAISCKDGSLTKYQVLSKISTLASRTYDLSEEAILDGLLERENLGSTGFGGGIAIPHCKLEGIEAPLGVFLSLSNGLDYDSVDEQAVDLVFALISPSNNGASHLRTLAEVSRLLRDEKSCLALRGAKNEDAVFAMLSVNSELSAA